MFQTAMRIACSMATRAFMGPRRAASLLYFAPKYVVFDRDSAKAAMPRAPLRWGSPGLVLLDFTRPADSLLPGAVPAQDDRWPAVGNTVMSAPVSAMMISATRSLMPGMLTKRSRAAANGANTSPMR